MSQTKETFTNTNSKCYLKEIRKINIVKAYGVCFVIVELKMMKRLIAFLALRKLYALYFKLLVFALDVFLYL
jgi:hypothetical protein